ncbi:hypothetical protein HZH66_012634 [Vespula vulgaris]|uniref:Uncharacterized protein n=1 Tax=Vespula vulgaris TaxID=7454 RepID=A0A834J9M0_VESVU|nr:hypothetical protein HZH66_012634 [Vespula vulgaris]
MTRSDMNVDRGISNRRSLVSVGKYQMIRLLGKGNFARVEEAIHTILRTKRDYSRFDYGRFEVEVEEKEEKEDEDEEEEVEEDICITTWLSANSKDFQS